MNEPKTEHLPPSDEIAALQQRSQQTAQQSVTRLQGWLQRMVLAIWPAENGQPPENLELVEQRAIETREGAKFSAQELEKVTKAVTGGVMNTKLAVEVARKWAANAKSEAPIGPSEANYRSEMDQLRKLVGLDESATFDQIAHAVVSAVEHWQQGGSEVPIDRTHSEDVEFQAVLGDILGVSSGRQEIADRARRMAEDLVSQNTLILELEKASFPELQKALDDARLELKLFREWLGLPAEAKSHEVNAVISELKKRKPRP